MKLLLRRCWLLIALLALSGWLSLSAQTGPVIEKIEINHVGPPAVSDDLVRANLHVKAGDRYNPVATDDDIAALKATGYFLNVRVAVDRTDSGVKLIYVLQGQPVLGDIRFQGNRKYNNGSLLKKVKSRVGQPLDEYKLFTDAQEIKKKYEKAGYRQTRVEPKESINAELGRATVTFEITEAPKVRIVDVQFVGAQALSQRKLRKQIKTRRHWTFSWLTGSGKLKEEQFQEDQEKLKDFYWSEGYIDFEINVAFAPVKILQLLLVLLKLLLFELATAGQPRKRPVPPRLELLAQFSLGKSLRADELNLHDPDVGRFLDVKRDRRAPELLVDALLGLDLRLLVTGFLVQLFDFLRVGKEFVIVQRLPHLRLHQLEQLGVAVFPVSLKPNLAEHRLALHHVNQLHASILRTVGLYPDVAK